MTGAPLHVTLVADLLSERWPSMDLTADRLHAELSNIGQHASVHVDMIRPDLRVRRGPFGRYITRFADYAWWLHRHPSDADVFHVVDHSYAHLVHVLPPERTVVTCHDVDAFLTLVDPDRATSRLPGVVTRLILNGLRRAAHVACVSAATRDEILKFGLIQAERLSVVHMGVHPAYRPDDDQEADAALVALLGEKRAPELLHVGSCIPRKRIDVLLKTLASIRKTSPDIRLVKAGGRLTDAQRAMAVNLGIASHVIELPHLETATLAALYRRVDAALITSEREGFGLPLVEALACGTPVVASDLPVLREVGGVVTVFAPAGDVPRWHEAVRATLAAERSPGRSDRVAARVAHASSFSWRRCADSMLTIYQRLAPHDSPTGSASASAARPV